MRGGFEGVQQFPTTATSTTRALRLIGLEAMPATREEVIAAWRRAVKAAHPDADPSEFRKGDLAALGEARDLLVSMIGTPDPYNSTEKKRCLVCGGTGRVYGNFAVAACSACGGTGVQK